MGLSHHRKKCRDKNISCCQSLRLSSGLRFDPKVQMLSALIMLDKGTPVPQAMDPAIDVCSTFFFIFTFFLTLAMPQGRAMERDIPQQNAWRPWLGAGVWGVGAGG